MTRPLAALLALIALPAVAPAQTVRPVGPPRVGGRAIIGPPIASGANALYPVQSAAQPRFTVGGGSLTVYNPVLVPTGPWGGVSYPQPVQPVIIEPAPAATTPARGAVAQRDLSGRVEATLKVDFPAAAEVWVGGKKLAGGPATEWTLTSPALAAEASHTFDVRARWKADGKTFEATRSVVVSAGGRDRWSVLSGTEIK